MGSVFRAIDRRSNRPVALKLLPPEGGSSPDDLARFSAEADVCARLDHPNILRIVDVDATSAPPYIVLELVEGGTLRTRLQRTKRLSMHETLGLMGPVYDAISYAHQRGVVHRDLKPENILLMPDGTPKIADFGLAKLSAAWNSGIRTKTGIILGTPTYMTPEQVQGRPVTQSADIYALGCITYELLVGQPPFTASTLPELLTKHLREDPPRLRKTLLDAPKILDDLIAASLAKDPSERFQDAAVIAEQFSSLRQQLSPQSSRRVPPSLRQSGPTATQSLPSARPAGEASTPRADAVGRRTSLHGRATELVRSSSSVVAVEPVSSPSSRFRMPLLAGVSALILSLVVRLLSGPASPVITAFRIDAVGARSVQFSWRSSWQSDSPSLIVGGVPVVGQLLAAEPSSGMGEPTFRHRVRVTGLSPSTDYEAAVVLPHGGNSLPVTFRTMGTIRFVPGVATGFDGNDRLKIELHSKLPFSAVVSLPDGTVTTAEDFDVRHTITLWSSLLQADEPAVLLVRSIDDEMVERTPIVDLFARELSRVYDLYETDRRSPEFYRMWAESSDGGNLFTAALKTWHQCRQRGDETAAKAGLSQFWQSTATMLRQRTRWFRALEPLLPGLSHLSMTFGLAPSLRQGLARAILPLELVNAGATRISLPRDELWQTIEDGCRPYDLLYDPSDLQRRGRCYDLDVAEGMPVFTSLLVDETHPSAGTIVETLARDIEPAVKRLRLAVTLPQPVVTDARNAWLELRLRSCWISHRLVADVNGDRFLAVFRHRLEDWPAASAWIDRIDMFKMMFSVALDPDFHDTSRQAIQKRFLKLADLFPPAIHAIWHPVDTAALVPGTNTVTIRMFLAPSRRDPDPPFIVSAHLWVEGSTQALRR